MYKRRVLIAILIVLVFLTSCSKKLKHRDDIVLSPAETAVCEDVAVPYVDFQNADGSPVSLSSFIDKPFFLYVSKVSDPVFSDVIEMINASALENSSLCQYVLVLPFKGEHPSLSAEYMEIDRRHITVLFDPDMSSSVKLMQNAMPFALFVDKDGFVAAQSTGNLTTEELAFGLDMIKNREA